MTATAKPLPTGGPAEPSLLRAAGWMAGWLVLMLLVPICGRALANDLDMIQVMFVRSVVGFLMMLPLVWMAGGLQAIRTRRLRLHAARNAIHYICQYGWLMAVMLIPLAQVVAIEFTMPIWTAILAVTMLGERMGRGRIAAVALGLIGVLVIVRPGVDTVSTGQWVALLTAVGFAFSVTMIKSLTRTESALSILFWMVVIQAVIGFIPALFVWRWPTPANGVWILLMAFSGTFSHYCMAAAMRHADAMVVIPMDFLRVPLTAVVGWMLYAEAVDVWFALGAGLILTGNVLNLRPQPVLKAGPADAARSPRPN